MTKLTHIPLNISAAKIEMKFEGQAAQLQPTMPRDVEKSKLKYAEWGDDGLLPTKWRLLFEKNTSAPAAIQKKVEIIYGEGVNYCRIKYDDKGNPYKDYTRDRRIDLFFRNNRIEDFIVARLKDFFYFGNLWAEHIKGAISNEVVSLRHLDSEFCRFHVRDEKDGLIKNIGHSNFFNQNPQPSNNEVTDIPLAPAFHFDAWYKEFNGKKFATHSALFSPGHTYYQLPPWAGLMRKNGWLEVSNSVPDILMPLHTNQVKLRYLIKVADAYWRFWHPDWDTYDEKEREMHIKNRRDELNNTLFSPNNGSRMAVHSILTTNFVDPVTQKIIPGVEIEAIDDKIKKDEYIPNSQAADSQIAIALGIDPSELGLQPEGGKMGAGSGSDKRTARTNMLTASKIYSDIFFQPLYTTAMCNNWGDDICFEFRYIVPTTLNENKQGLEIL